MDNVIHALIEADLRKSFQRYGLEGTEEKVNQNYKECPQVKEQYLEVYREILTRKKP